MPIYNWIDKRTGKDVDVIRDFEKFEFPPDRDEVPNMTDQEYTDAEWERQIAPSKWIRGWSGGKGAWIQLLSGGWLCSQLPNWLS